MKGKIVRVIALNFLFANFKLEPRYAEDLAIAR